MPGSEITKPASVPSSVSCALKPAKPSARSVARVVVVMLGDRPPRVVDALARTASWSAAAISGTSAPRVTR